MARRNPRYYVKIALILTGFIFLSLYAVYQTRALVGGPELFVAEPKNGSNFSSPEIVVSGKAQNISFITLNGLQIFTDEAGNFARRLVLAPGYNVITLEAKDKFNRSIRKTIQVTQNI